ncbi:MAG: acetylxylan esterase, partial [Planctomycetaceae bacterium]|nr:acetylxylan esterase [Planctomycetaceae bacterium]
MFRTLAILALLASLTPIPAAAQPKGYNYDEAKVPKYTLPDPLILSNGAPVKDANTWRNKRRPEIVRLFETQVYGRSPQAPQKMRFEVFEQKRGALGGLADRKQVSVFFTGKSDGPSMDILIYTPAGTSKPVPTFLGLNFGGNHTIRDEKEIRLSTRWMRPKSGIKKNRADEATRGASASRWAVETIVKRGYALATIYCGDVDPDYHDGFTDGVHAMYPKPKADEWGTIGAWAWGLSRAVDYFETDDTIDAKRVAVLGHSRLGKTSLWAGASDERFALVISNDSGCGGAALSRRRFGETVQRINTSFPHWFCDNFEKYNSNEDALPVDQHML